MAVLVGQEHPGAIRRTPSSGDGGVDLLIDEGDGWHVRQIKGFVGRLDGNRRRKIEKSFADVLKDPRLGRPILRWSLTVPIDPTSGEQRWFEELTADASFPCNWDGEIYWHGMAASQPHVIDYYLRDGRARVEGRSDALLSAARAPSAPLSALDVAGHLGLLRASLNRDDPHYRYEFSTGAAAPDPASLPPGIVLAVSTSMDDGQLLTVFVIERHRYSTEDSPIGGTLTVRVRDPDRGIDLREAFDEFRTFGVGVDLPDGTLDAEVSGPGGLGGSFTGGAGRIGPMLVTDPPERTRLRLRHPDEGTAAELGIQTVSVTRGQLGGVELTATDGAGVLSVRFRLWPDEADGVGKLTFDTALQGLHGRPVQDVVPAARLLARFSPPHELQWLEEFGSRVLAAHPFPDDIAPVSQGLFRFLEDLAVIQDHVRDTVIVPDNIDPAAVRNVATVAQLIRHGEVRGTWTNMMMHLHEGVVPEQLTVILGGPGALIVESAWSLELEGRVYDIGLVQQLAATARLADEQPEDGRSVRLVPGDDNTVVQRLGSVRSGTEQQDSPPDTDRQSAPS